MTTATAWGKLVSMDPRYPDVELFHDNVCYIIYLFIDDNK